MDIHIIYIFFFYIFENSQSPWYLVSEKPPGFEFSSNFTWANLISVKIISDFLQNGQVEIIFLRKSKYPR